MSIRRVLAALLVAALPILAACSTPPSVAAEVGQQQIAEAAIFARSSELADRAAARGTPAGAAEFAELNRSQLTTEIRAQLLDIAATEQGITVTNEEINTVLAGRDTPSAAAQLGVPESAVAQTVGNLLRLERLIEMLPPAGAEVTNVTVLVEGVTEPDRDAAVATRTAFLSDPTAASNRISSGSEPVERRELSLLQAPAVGATGIFAADVGDVVLYPSATDYLVLRVLQRTEEPTRLTAADLRTQPVSQVFELGALLLTPTGEQAGVTVNPRLGTWDPLSLQVIPSNDGM